MGLDLPPPPELPPYQEARQKRDGREDLRDHCLDFGCVRGGEENPTKSASSSPSLSPAGVSNALKVNLATVRSVRIKYGTEASHRVFGAEAKTVPSISSSWPTVEKNVLELLKNRIKEIAATIREAKKKLLLLDYLEHEGAEAGDSINFPELIKEVREQGEVPEELFILAEFIDYKNQARRGDHGKEKRRGLENEIRASERELATIITNFKGKPLIINRLIEKTAAETDRQMVACVELITSLLQRRMELQKKLEFARGKDWYEISDEIREMATIFAAKLPDKQERHRNTRAFKKLRQKNRTQRAKPYAEQGLRPKIGMGGRGKISDRVFSVQRDRVRRHILQRILKVFTREDGVSRQRRARAYRRNQRMDRDAEQNILDPQLESISIAEREERKAEEMFKVKSETHYQNELDAFTERENEEWNSAGRDGCYLGILDDSRNYDQGDLPSLVNLHRKYAKDIRKMARNKPREETMWEEELGRSAVFDHTERAMERVEVKQLEASLYLPERTNGQPQTRPNGHRSVRHTVRQQLAYVCARNRGPIDWLQ